MTTLTIGQGKQFTTVSAAVAASRDGDVLAIDAGVYVNDFATIGTKITLKGVGGVAEMVATQAPGNGKGILITNTDITIENMAFSGTAVPDGNGAGIRYQDGHLTITNSFFHHNQNGLLANPAPNGSITIRNSEFSQNGVGNGLTHNLYVSEVGTLTVSDSYFHDASVGHQIKSRALNTTITNSRIADGETGTGSYSIDLPSGGRAVISGNLIEQGANGRNPALISFGVEGNVHGGSSLELSGNTFINNFVSPSATILWNATGTVANLSGNTVSGIPANQYVSGPANISGMTVLAPGAVVGTPAPTKPSPVEPTPVPAAVEAPIAAEPIATPTPAPAPVVEEVRVEPVAVQAPPVILPGPEVVAAGPAESPVVVAVPIVADPIKVELPPAPPPVVEEVRVEPVAVEAPPAVAAQPEVITVSAPALAPVPNEAIVVAVPPAFEEAPKDVAPENALVAEPIADVGVGSSGNGETEKPLDDQVTGNSSPAEEPLPDVFVFNADVSAGAVTDAQPDQTQYSWLEFTRMIGSEEEALGAQEAQWASDLTEVNPTDVGDADTVFGDALFG